MSKRKTVICTCATSLATSTQYARIVQELAKKINVPVKTEQLQLAGSILEDYLKRNGKPDLVVGTPAWGVKKRLAKANASDVPVVDGIPLLTGVGRDKVEEEILKELKK